MASAEIRNELESAFIDLRMVERSQQFRQIADNSILFETYKKMATAANLWQHKVTPYLDGLENDGLLPIIRFTQAIVRIAEGNLGTLTYAQAFERSYSEFKAELPMVAIALLDASGVLGDSAENIRHAHAEAVSDIAAATQRATSDFRTQAEETIAQVKIAQRKAREIAVGGAQNQFITAATGFRVKAICWGGVAFAFFATLVFLLNRLFARPPMLIAEIERMITAHGKETISTVPLPLLLTAGAYFTSVRLALIGAIGIGLAFSLRMTRAYVHMSENNWHKLRVTNSFEAFSAAVLSDERKDLVLGKLIESVTEFGDTGILDKTADAQTLPSVVFESITKGVSRSE